MDTVCKLWPLAMFGEWCGAIVFNAKKAEAERRRVFRP